MSLASNAVCLVEALNYLRPEHIGNIVDVEASLLIEILLVIRNVLWVPSPRVRPDFRKSRAVSGLRSVRRRSR